VVLEVGKIRQRWFLSWLLPNCRWGGGAPPGLLSHIPIITVGFFFGGFSVICVLLFLVPRLGARAVRHE